tara:strand:+ start:657 stop:1055 length:399 start_codon:yes stop_codon:yes gene_type:complete
MKKTELKKIIKPLVKECINEVLLEEGLLSNVVSEVVRGVVSQNLVEQSSRPQHTEPKNIGNQKLKEQREKLLNTINKDAYNGVDLFEGTQAISSYEAQDQKPGTVDLGNPNDAGVDISSIMGASSKIWERLK